MSVFQLDDRLARDSLSLTKLSLCDLRLSKDSRWPWLMLVPQRPDLTELFEMTPLDQTMLTFEQTLVAGALKKVTGADKINVASIGNIVRQIHVHVVARFEGDPNWPAPIWGYGQPVPYEEERQQQLTTSILEALHI